MLIIQVLLYKIKGLIFLVFFFFLQNVLLVPFATLQFLNLLQVLGLLTDFNAQKLLRFLTGILYYIYILFFYWVV